MVASLIERTHRLSDCLIKYVATEITTNEEFMRSNCIYALSRSTCMLNTFNSTVKITNDILSLKCHKLTCDVKRRQVIALAISHLWHIQMPSSVNPPPPVAWKWYDCPPVCSAAMRSLQCGSSSAIPTGFVHKFWGTKYVCMCLQLKRCCVVRILQWGQSNEIVKFDFL